MKNILVVHYDSEVIEKITSFLFQDMFDLTIAGDAAVARVLLAKKSFDMMITASLLPKSHGFTLAQYVHEHFPQTKIIILCDKLEDETYLQEGYTTGACEILAKTVKKNEFCEKVMSHLGVNQEFLATPIDADSTRIDLKPLLFNLKSVQNGKIPPVKNNGFENIIKDVQQEGNEPFEIKLD